MNDTSDGNKTYKIIQIELQSWVEALEKYDAGDYIHALRQFSTMQSRGQSSKIEFNRAVIHASLGDQKGATELYNSSLRIDPYFAIAYFQSGVCNFMRGRYEHARNDYEASQAQLRGNPHIDYNQLGLAYKLESANINFNIALTFYYSGRPDDGISHIQLARNGASLDQNSVIDDCLRDEAKVRSISGTRSRTTNKYSSRVICLTLFNQAWFLDLQTLK